MLVRGLRSRLTEAEAALWKELRLKQMDGNRFRRQHPLGGKFVADFICLKKKLIIEVDGSQHADLVEEDAKRTQWLEDEGYTVLRFWNHEVLKEMESVKQRIWENLNK